MRDVEDALAWGTETRSVEVKAACLPSEKAPVGGIVRAVLAMSNIVDGGHVIVGVDDGAMAAMTPGLRQDQLAAWLTNEPLYDTVAKYADPPIALTFKDYNLSNGAAVICIDVPGIAGEPHFCMKNLQDNHTGKQVLREGALYVRSITKPESVAVEDRATMEEILESATAHRLQAFVEQANNAGLELGITPLGDTDYFEQRRTAGFE